MNVDVNVRHWRTRKDPFESVWDECVEMLRIMPELDAVTLFRYFQEKGCDFEEGQLRTFQRRVTGWKAVNGPEHEVFFDQISTPGEVLQLDWMHDKLSVTVGGERFDHLLCHCVLVFSKWEYARVCFSENLLSLRVTLQGALLALGRCPKVLQIDNSSAATHHLGKGYDRRGFTEKFQTVLNHFGLKCRTIGVACANENGTVERMHGHLRRRLDQALVLRGSRDFSSQSEYEGFVGAQLIRANGFRQVRLTKELEQMRLLDRKMLTEFEEEAHRIGVGSTLRICKRVYSVPSRLIGRRVSCRIYQDRIELYEGAVRVHVMARVYSGNGVDWRDLIGSMVSKPGAFSGYRHRDAFFPSELFERLFERLQRDRGDWQGKVEYLQFLSMCRELEDERIESMLAAGGDAVTPTVLREELGVRPVLPELAAFEPDLKAYDCFVGEVGNG